MTTPRARVEAIERICLSAHPAYDAAVLGPDAARFDVYRRMVRARFRDVLIASAPRFAKAAGDEVIDTWLTRWLDADGPSTRQFWALPLTAERFVTALRDEGLVAPSHHALALYELSMWRVRHATFAIDGVVEPLDFARVPVLTNARHRLDLEFAPSETPTVAEASRFVFVRRTDDTVRVRSLDRIGALIFDAVARGGEATLTERVRDVVSANGLGATAAFAASVGALFAAWTEDGLLLGSRAG